MPKYKKVTNIIQKQRNYMSKKAQKHEPILGIGVSSTQRQKLLSSLRSALVSWSQKRLPGNAKLIVTPNPEIVNRSLNDKNLAKILNSADISLPDGVGLVAAHRFINLKAPKFILFRPFSLLIDGIRVGYATLFDRKWLFKDLEVIKGREFFMDLIKLANKKGWRVLLLGGSGVSYDLKESLKRSFKKIRIKAEEGPRLNEGGNPLAERDIRKEKEVIEKINKFEPELLFVAFGAPKQEKWLNKWLPDLKVGAAMTVGGTFDYLSGRVALPPRWMSGLGLEWLWRVVNQPNPKRVKRVLTAFPIFPLKVFWYKLLN